MDDENVILGQEGEAEIPAGPETETIQAADEIVVGKEQADGEDSGADKQDDLSQPMFAYDPGDGNEVQLTGEELLQKLAELEELKQAQPKDESSQDLLKQLAEQLQQGKTKQQEDASADDLEFYRQAGLPEPYQVDWGRVGNDLVSILEGSYPIPGTDKTAGPEILGDSLKNLMANVVYEILPKVMPKQLAAQTEVEQTRNVVFQEFPGLKDALENRMIDKFQQENSLYAKATKLEAYLAMQTKEQAKQLSELQKQIEEAKTQGIAAGKKEAVKQLRTKANIRLLMAGGRQGPPPPPQPSGKDDDWLQTLQQLRNGH